MRETLLVSDRADFCVGYFNLRGWKHIDSYIEEWPGGEGNCCRLLVGMQRLPEEELKEALSLIKKDSVIDNQTALRIKKKLAEDERNLFITDEFIRSVEKVVYDIYRHPLRQLAVDTLNRQLRSGISDENLAHLVVTLREDGRLCIIHEEEATHDPRIICSLGLFGAGP